MVKAEVVRPILFTYHHYGRVPAAVAAAGQTFLQALLYLLISVLLFFPRHSAWWLLNRQAWLGHNVMLHKAGAARSLGPVENTLR